jgi:hypothetical protein
MRAVPHLLKDIADDFFGVVTVAEHTHGDGEHAIDGEVVEPRERGLVATQDRVDQRDEFVVDRGGGVGAQSGAFTAILSSYS